jgi:hypothetical protein
MAKQALSADQEKIVESLIKELGSGSVSLPDMLRKAVAEGALWGGRESRRVLAQQVQAVLGEPVAHEAPRTIAVASQPPTDAQKKLSAREAPRTIAVASQPPTDAQKKPSAHEAPRTIAVASQPPTDAQKKPSECPVPRCHVPGVKQFHNFCRKHYNSLPESKKKELRAKQLLARKPPPRQIVICPVPNCTNTGIRTMHNFCWQHYNSLPEDNRKELRAKQLAAHRKERKLLRTEAARANEGK